jgi:hypothetical protein
MRSKSISSRKKTTRVNYKNRNNNNPTLDEKKNRCKFFVQKKLSELPEETMKEAKEKCDTEIK